jgi:hypothetical protein
MLNTTKIRELNDAFRQTLCGGKIVMTSGIAARPDIPAIIERVRTFAAFDPGSDPYAEHDFGAFRIVDQQIFWKIDYYDLDLTGGSSDPSEPAVTSRILTIMLAEEY